MYIRLFYSFQHCSSVFCVLFLCFWFFFTIQNVMIFSSRLTVNLTECLILIDDVRIGSMFTDGTDGI